MVRTLLGGVYGLELPGRCRVYHKLPALNLARNAFRCLLKLYNVREIFLPDYICPLMFKIVEEEGCKYQLYTLGEDFLPVKVPTSAYLLYPNYFGLQTRQVNTLLQQYPHLWVDNAQSFYSDPVGEAGFYSPRKFFGVADGSYVYARHPDLPKQVANLARDLSYERSTYLLQYLDVARETSYHNYQFQENLLRHLPPRRMSQLTETLLQHMNYSRIAQQRRKNFCYLHSRLVALNTLKIDLLSTEVPFIYPLLCSKAGLPEYLLQNGVFLTRYWPSLERICQEGSWARHLANNLLPLPIEQRYTIREMEKLATLIWRYIH